MVSPIRYICLPSQIAARLARRKGDTLIQQLAQETWHQFAALADVVPRRAIWVLLFLVLLVGVLNTECLAQQCQMPSGRTKMAGEVTQKVAKNVVGTELAQCGCNPMTGFFRDGFCHTETRDVGRHTVCAIMTDEFLQFTRSRGNDLSSPVPQFGFPGLKAGDRWCLCVSRWKEAYEAGVAPPVILEATHEQALKTVRIEELRSKELQ